MPSAAELNVWSRPEAVVRLIVWALPDRLRSLPLCRGRRVTGSICGTC